MNEKQIDEFIRDAIFPVFGIDPRPEFDINAFELIINLKKERDKAIDMVRTMAHQFGTCDGCKHLGSKCSVSDYWCKKDGKDHWEWEGL